MSTLAELGQEYLKTAEKILLRLQAAKAETGPDYQGKRAKRIALLEEMYFESRATGNHLIRREDARK